MDKYQCLKLIRCQVFSPNCQKITWGHHGGVWYPLTPPHIIFSKNKNYLSNQMHSIFPRTKITGGGHQTLPTLCPPPITSLTSTPHTPPPHPTNSTTTHPHPTTHPTTNPWRKSGTIMPDISQASPHCLPIQ